METINSKVHRGKILHAAAKRGTKTIVRIACEAGYEKSSFYMHIKQAQLPLDILFKYRKAIPHQFEMEIPEMSVYLDQNLIKKAIEKKSTYEELQLEKDFWRDKFYMLLEEHHKLLKELL